jgi:hypothetical protein
VRFLPFLCLAALLIAAAPDTVTTALDPVSSLRHPAAAPALGSAPQTSSNEVEPFRMSGGAVVQGQAVVEFLDGRYYPCLAGCHVLLFPDTPYVRWRLVTWARDVDGTVAASDAAWWGGAAMGALPAYYRIFDDESVVRDTTCDDYGDFRFTDLPHGNYIVAFHAYNTIQTFGRDVSELDERLDGTVAGDPLEGYIVRSNSLPVTDDLVYTLSVSKLNVIAHLYGGG